MVVVVMQLHSGCHQAAFATLPYASDGGQETILARFHIVRRGPVLTLFGGGCVDPPPSRLFCARRNTASLSCEKVQEF